MKDIGSLFPSASGSSEHIVSLAKSAYMQPDPENPESFIPHSDIEGEAYSKIISSLAKKE